MKHNQINYRLLNPISNYFKANNDKKSLIKSYSARTLQSKQITDHSFQVFKDVHDIKMKFTNPYVQQLCQIIIDNYLDPHISDIIVEVLKFCKNKSELAIKLEKQLQQIRYQTQYQVKAMQKKDEMYLEVKRENINLKTQILQIQKELKKLHPIYENKDEKDNQNVKQIESEKQIIIKQNFIPKVDKVQTNNILPVFEQKDTKSKFSQIVQAAIIQNMLNSAQKYPKSQSNQIQTQKDQLFFRILLDISIDDDDIMSMFLTNKNILKFNELLNLDQNKFIQAYIEDQTIHTEFLTSSKYILSFMNTLMEAFLKMKKLLKAESRLHSSLELQDSFQLIASETCTILSCDRATVFLLDRHKHELWTKAAVGAKSIRISATSGIAGYVATTGKYLNVIDARSDKRFNQEIDQLMNYRTKSILCVPIRDGSGSNVIGVIQAINKNVGYFGKDDEGIILLLSHMASGVFTNSLFHDSKTMIQNHLHHLIQSGIEMNRCKTLQELQNLAEDQLTEVFDIQQAYVNYTHTLIPNQVYFHSKKYQCLLRYDKESNLVRINNNMGIIGHVYSTGKQYSTKNCYKDPLFNQLADLDTLLPVLTMPIKESQQHSPLGVLQVIDNKGILNIQYANTPSSDNPFYDTVKQFAKMLSSVLLCIEE